MKATRIIKSFTGIVLAIFMTTGCGVLKPIENTSSDRKWSLQQRRATPVYHDFDDILIPGELKLNRRISSVSRAETIPAGVLSLAGKIDSETLIQFFKSNMAKDNWRLVSESNASRSLLLFEKGNRWCVITLAADRYGTQADIWVAPKTGGLE